MRLGNKNSRTSAPACLIDVKSTQTVQRRWVVVAARDTVVVTRNISLYFRFQARRHPRVDFNTLCSRNGDAPPSSGEASRRHCSNNAILLGPHPEMTHRWIVMKKQALPVSRQVRGDRPPRTPATLKPGLPVVHPTRPTYLQRLLTLFAS